MQDESSILSRSPSETLKLGRALALKVQKGQVLALKGPLGAGKTTFAKGFISEKTGLTEDEITSPSFTLVEEYPGGLYHADLYRILNPAEAKALAWDDLFSPEAMTLIEWPEHLPGLISHCHWVLEFSRNKKDVRMIKISRQLVP